MSFISTILCCPATLTTTNRSAVVFEEEGAVVAESLEPGLVFSLPGERIPPSDFVLLSRDLFPVLSGNCVAGGLVGLVGPP